MVQVYALKVLKQDVKQVKTQLESRSIYHKRHRIQPCEDASQALMSVPTTVRAHPIRDEEVDENVLKALADMGHETVVLNVTNPSTSSISQDPLAQGLQHAINTLPPEFWSTYMAGLMSLTLLATFKPSYQMYPPLLLLNATVVKHPGFTELLRALSVPDNASLKATFFTTLARSTNVTHIALNAPIPFSTTTATPSSPSSTQTENILRSPTNLTPLHGPFGPSPPIPHPSPQDFSKALWVSTTQNTIHQIWAPLHSMFARGNIREKARLLALPSVRQALREGSSDEGNGRGCSAVDLFVGIGYFAFSYARAGVDCVLGWDLNPWSCEGLRRGAAANGWSCAVFTANFDDVAVAPAFDAVDEDGGLPRLVVFNEDNGTALGRVEVFRRGTGRGRIPPVRHVNCGMLPSAGTAAWETAVRVLDGELGGWVHLHEVVRVGRVRERGEEMRKMVGEFWRGLKREKRSVDGGKSGKEGEGEEHKVELLHVERVKSVGPKMVHIVVDLWIPPLDKGRPEPHGPIDDKEKDRT